MGELKYTNNRQSYEKSQLTEEEKKGENKIGSRKPFLSAYWTKTVNYQTKIGCQSKVATIYKKAISECMTFNYP